MSLRTAPILCAVLWAALAAWPVSAWARSPAPTEAQCRQAVDSLVRTIKSTPASSSKENQRLAALIKRVETMLEDHRTRGIGACESWAALNKLVAQQ